MSSDSRIYLKSDSSSIPSSSTSKLMAAVSHGSQPTRISGSSLTVLNASLPKERKVIYIAPVDTRSLSSAGPSGSGQTGRPVTHVTSTPPRNSFEGGVAAVVSNSSSSNAGSARNLAAAFRITPARQLPTPTQSVSNQDHASSQNTARVVTNRPLGLNHQSLGQIPLNLNSGGMVAPRREKSSKGLRHFAMRVCQKVRQKVVTSYNEVADELVGEMSDGSHQSQAERAYDQKNIRRRVYDALNVLMAMRIIAKEKKEIRWLGLPTNYEERYREMEDEKRLAQERIRAKVQNVQELLLQQVAVRQLIEQNRSREMQEGGPPPSDTTLRLPFIVVSTGRRAVIDCSISADRQEYVLAMDQPFELQDETDVMRRMGLTLGLDTPGRCNDAALETAVRLVPPLMEPFIREMARSGVNGQSAIAVSANLRIPELPQSVNRQLFGGVSARSGLSAAVISFGENAAGKANSSTNGADDDDDVDIADEDDDVVDEDEDEDIDDDEDVDDDEDDDDGNDSRLLADSRLSGES